jgi:hypothetical protein
MKMLREQWAKGKEEGRYAETQMEHLQNLLQNEPLMY